MKKENIKLELLTKSDRSEYFNLIEKNRDNLRIFMDWVDTTRQECDLDDFLDRSEKMYHDGNGCNYKIVEDNSIIGSIDFFRTGESETIFEIGYWLDIDKRKQGIISSMVPGVEAVCFNDYNAGKIEIWCAKINIGSNKVAQKNQYKLERAIDKHKKLCGVVLDYNVYSKYLI